MLRDRVPYALNLTLDVESSNEIERIYVQLAELGVPDHDLVSQYGPCVTVLVIGDVITSRIVGRTLELHLPTQEALPVTFTQPCVIDGTPPTLSLRVGPTEPLLSLHSALYSEFAENDVHLHYRPAYWQPHLKLCNIRADHNAADKLLKSIAAGWSPRPAMLVGLEAIHYPPTESVWHARLKQPATR